MSSAKPLVSIYATVYNNASSIRKSLDSLLRIFPNLEKNFELVVVDNYSTDGTWEILKEYAKRHKTFKIHQASSNRGRGRGLAYAKSSGRYVFYVDLDTVYEREFAQVMYHAFRNYRENTSVIGFMSRKTMDRIGNWADLAGDEDTEFFARAISKGIKIYDIPAFLLKNEILEKRERRYAANIIGYLVRGYKRAYDLNRAIGTKSLKEAGHWTFVGNLAFKITYLHLKLTGTRIYRHSKEYNNSELLNRNKIFLNPSEFGIPKSKWIYTTIISSPESANRWLTQFFKMGFNRAKVMDTRTMLVYTDKTDKKLFDYSERFYKTAGNYLI